MTNRLTILDGGMGKELARIGAPFEQPEWSALALLESPESVRQAHQNFVDAGADVITTNAYAVVPYHIGDERFAERGAELAALSADIAREVADAADRPVRVAGSIPPLFGSYEPDKFEPKQAPALWDVLVDAQAEKVDLWLGETISSLAEYHAIVAALADRTEEFWAAFTLTDDVPEGTDESTFAQIRSGESIAEVAEAITATTTAILFNCSQPERIEPALVQLVETLGPDSPTAVGAYANAFVEKTEGYASNSVILALREDLTPESYAATDQRWVDLGATLIGGCCGIRPDHIEALTKL